MATIYALASAKGRGGVAIIRVSGLGAKESLLKLCDFTGDIEPRRAYFRKIYKPDVSRETYDMSAQIDEAVVLYFAGPNSFTGEDVVEYHCHGGRAITEALMEALSGFEDHRMAEPGEFTRRAFENGKIDLTQAEAVADLVDAETEYQRQQALAQAGGALYRLYEGWRSDIVHILAYAEAHLDFPDEDDVPETLSDDVCAKINALISTMESHLNDARRGERLRDGVRVAIIGAPNAGKSSLLNNIAQRDVAIVSDIAGTTRDVLEVPLDLGGYPVILTDTAGLRPDDLDGSDQSRIEEEGIKRAIKIANEADLKILLFNAADLPDLDKHTLALKDENALLVMNKMDLAQNPEIPENFMPISLKDGTGINECLGAVTKMVEERYGYTDTPALTRERHREALIEAKAAMERALREDVLELSAENIRQSAVAIGRITGKIDVEQLLDVIFADFCIGK